MWFGILWAVPFHMVFASLLLVGVFTDIDHFILPDGITIGGLIFALATAAVLGNRAVITYDFHLSRDIFYSFYSPNELGNAGLPSRGMVILWSFASALFGYGLLAGVGRMGRIMFQKEAMGGGDIKLFAFLGAYLGALNCLWILFLSALLGSVIGLTFILTHKLVGKDEYEELQLAADSAVEMPWRTVDFRSATGIQKDTVAVVSIGPE